MIRRQKLHDGWTLLEPKSGRWLKAEVPDCLHQDLLRHDLIPAPFSGDNELTLGWIIDSDWTYRRQFTADGKVLGREVVELIPDGRDTVARQMLLA